MLGCGREKQHFTDAMEGALPWWRRWLHRAHLSLCPMCRCYEHQLEATVKAVGDLATEPPAPRVKEKLLEAFRSRCKKA